MAGDSIWNLTVMIKLAIAIASLVPATSVAAAREGTTTMDITRKADLIAVEGPAEYFTGKATITGQFQRPDPSHISGAFVHFEPGARTAWHKHPAGQTLIVTEGVGWTQLEDGPKLEFYAGDVLWCPANHKHWHGATAHEAMTHIAIQDTVDGRNVVWMEKVTDEEYLAPLGSE